VVYLPGESAEICCVRFSRRHECIQVLSTTENRKCVYGTTQTRHATIQVSKYHKFKFGNTSGLGTFFMGTVTILTDPTIADA
jgi:hypothetical protein